MSSIIGDDGQHEENWEATIAGVTPATRDQADSWTDSISQTLNNIKDFGKDVLDLAGDIAKVGPVDEIWGFLSDVVGSDSREEALEHVHEATGGGTWTLKIVPPQIPWFSFEFGTVSREKEKIPETIGEDNIEVPDYGTRTKVEFAAEVEPFKKYTDKVGLTKYMDGFPQIGLTLVGDHYERDLDGDPFTQDFAVRDTEIKLGGKLPFAGWFVDDAAASATLLEYVKYKAEEEHDYPTWHTEKFDFFPGVGAKFNSHIGRAIVSADDWWNAYFADEEEVENSLTWSGDWDNDTFDGSDEDEVVNGQAGADAYNTKGGEDRIIVDAEDRFERASGDPISKIHGGSGEDTLEIASDETISGWIQLEAADEVSSSFGNDVTGIEHVVGNDQDNWVLEASNRVDDNQFYGEGGDDKLHGKGGNDVLNGGAGNDTVAGGKGHDEIAGGPGQDKLSGGDGKDKVTVDGDDKFTIRPNSSKAYVDGGPGFDTLILSEGMNLNGFIENETPGNHTSWANDVTNFPHIVGNSSDNHIADGADGYNVFDGRQGDDQLYGKGYHDKLVGGPGNDKLQGGAGNDTLVVDDEDSFTLIDNHDAGRIHGGSGHDWVFFDQGAEITDWFQLEEVGRHSENFGLDVTGVQSVKGNGFDNKILEQTGRGQQNYLQGRGGDDQLYGKGGDDRIWGGEGDDVLGGGKGDDKLFGREGADTFDGGPGDDKLFVEPGDSPGDVDGGTGYDEVVFMDSSMDESVWQSNTDSVEAFSFN